MSLLVFRLNLAAKDMRTKGSPLKVNYLDLLNSLLNATKLVKGELSVKE